MLLNFADLFLVDKEEATHLTEMCDFGSEQQVVDVFQCVVKLRSFVSAILEMPRVVVCIPRVFSLIVVRECVEGSTILILISRYDANDVWVWTHDDPGITRWNAPPFTVSNDTGDEVDPAIEIESYRRQCLSSSCQARRQQLSSDANPRRNKWYSSSHAASLRPCTPGTSGMWLLGQSRSAGHCSDSGMGGHGTCCDLRVSLNGRCWNGEVNGCWCLRGR